MRVAIDARMAQSPRVGVSEYVTNLCTGLAGGGTEHTFILFLKGTEVPPALRELSTATNVEFRLGCPGYEDHLRRDAWEQLTLPRILRHLQVDVYHSPNYVLPVLRSIPCASVVTFHDASMFRLPQAYRAASIARVRWLVRRAGRVADQVVFVSNFTAEECSHFLGPEVVSKGTVIYSALPRAFEDALQTHAGRRRSESETYVVSIGSVHPRKNYARLVDALRRPELSELHLLIVGQIAWKAAPLLEEVAADHDLARRVRFLGHLPTPELVQLLQGARAVVIPSLYEGFGLPVLEGFAARIPVASSDGSSMTEIAGGAALLFDPNSVDAMADAIRRLLHDPGLRDELVEAGTARLRDFSWNGCVDQHLEVYATAFERRLAHR